jgi:hypothetical protein
MTEHERGRMTLTGPIASAMLSLAAALPLAACDALADENTAGPPIATVGGTIEPGDDPPEDPQNVNLALVWRPGLFQDGSGGEDDDPDRTEYDTELVGQNVEFEATFPIEYQLDITEPPPEHVLRDLTNDEGLPYRLGNAYLVAYEDSNENGALDPCSGKGPCADRMLAASWRSWITTVDTRVEIDRFEIKYFDRGFTDLESGITFEPGYNLMRSRNFGPEDEWINRVSLDTPIPLELTSDPFVQNLICDPLVIEHPNRPTDDEEGDRPPRPAPPDAEIACDLDGRGYDWDLYQCQACVCFSDQDHVRLEDGDPVPADWPCEVP